MAAAQSQIKPTSTSFNTLDREKGFSHPSSTGPKYTAPQDLVAPHIQSFDALFEGAPIGPDGDVSASQGLLDLAVADLLPKVVFDGKGDAGQRGNKIEREFTILLLGATLEATSGRVTELLNPS